MVCSVESGVLLVVYSMLQFADAQFFCHYTDVAVYKVLDTSGFIENPGYPGYKSCKQYEWRINANSTDDVIKYRWCVIDMEIDITCSLDYVKTSAEMWLPRCGQEYQYEILFAQGSMNVTFLSDIMRTRSGFRLAFCSGENCEPHCPGEFVYSAPGTSNITSPGYPSAYPTSTDRCWLVRTAANHLHIFYRFCHFDVEVHQFCTFDSVVINDGELLCGRQNHSIHRAGRELLVCFHSDIREMYPGFHLQYCVTRNDTECRPYCQNIDGVTEMTSLANPTTTNYPTSTLEPTTTLNPTTTAYVETTTVTDIPTTTLSALTTHESTLPLRVIENRNKCAEIEKRKMNVNEEYGHIQNRGFPGYVTCMQQQWFISAKRSSHVIRYRWCVVDMEDQKSCMYDYVTNSAERYLRRCGHEYEYKILQATGGMTLTFFSDVIGTSVGFRLAFCVGQQCVPECPDEKILNKPADGGIYSPGYPAPYPHNHDSLWLMRTNTSTLHLYYRFCEFDLCANDSVKVNAIQMCGQHNDSIRHAGRQLSVSFHSDDRHAESGFNLAYCVTKTPHKCTPNCSAASGPAPSLNIDLPELTSPEANTPTPFTPTLPTEPVPTTAYTKEPMSNKTLNEFIEKLLCQYVKIRLEHHFEGHTKLVNRLMTLVLEQYLSRCPKNFETLRLP